MWIEILLENYKNFESLKIIWVQRGPTHILSAWLPLFSIIS